MPVSTLMTAEQFFELSAELTHAELVEGELQNMTPSGSEHGGIAFELMGELRDYLKKHRLGKGFNDSGFVTQRDPDTVLAPDGAFVSREKLAGTGVPTTFFPFAPDLALEIISPHERLKDVERKAQRWLAAGTRLVWVINPRNRTATIYRPDASPTVIDEHGDLTGEDVLPGFRVRLGDVLI